MKYQTMTFQEQSKVLQHLARARQALKQNKSDNDEKKRLIDEINHVFHSVQVANTQEL